MEKRILVVVLVLGLLGWLGLLAIQWQFGLGRFARSPQEVLLSPGRRTIVGGGRAVVGLVGRRSKTVRVEVRCADETRRFDLAEGARSEEVCGVTLRWFDAADLLRAPFGSARFEVSWEDVDLSRKDHES